MPGYDDPVNARNAEEYGTKHAQTSKTGDEFDTSDRVNPDDGNVQRENVARSEAPLLMPGATTSGGAGSYGVSGGGVSSDYSSKGPSGIMNAYNYSDPVSEPRPDFEKGMDDSTAPDASFDTTLGGSTFSGETEYESGTVAGKETNDKTTSSDSPDSSMVKFMQSVGSAVGNEKLAEKGREKREEKTHGTDDGQDESSV